MNIFGIVTILESIVKIAEKIKSFVERDKNEKIIDEVNRKHGRKNIS